MNERIENMVALQEHFEKLLDAKEQAVRLAKSEIDRRLEDLTLLREERGGFISRPEHDILVGQITLLQVWRGNIEGRIIAIAGLAVLFNLIMDGVTIYLALKK